MLYTDGLTDAYAPDRTLAPDDLDRLLASCAGRSASEIVDRMLQAALDDDSSSRVTTSRSSWCDSRHRLPGGDAAERNGDLRVVG